MGEHFRIEIFNEGPDYHVSFRDEKCRRFESKAGVAKTSYESFTLTDGSYEAYFVGFMPPGRFSSLSYSN